MLVSEAQDATVTARSQQVLLLQTTEGRDLFNKLLDNGLPTRRGGGAKFRDDSGPPRRSSCRTWMSGARKGLSQANIYRSIDFAEQDHRKILAKSRLKLRKIEPVPSPFCCCGTIQVHVTLALRLVDVKLFLLPKGWASCSKAESQQHLHGPVSLGLG